MFEFEKYALKSEDLNQAQTHFLFPDFLVEQAITMFYGPPKQGKTWLLYGITRHLCEHERVKKVFYVDYDNPKRQLKERNVNDLLDEYPDKLRYFSKGSTPYRGMELIEQMSLSAVGDSLKGYVFVYDSTRDFVDDTNSPIQTKRFMEYMKLLREAGATVLLIHHTTKSGKVIDGSAEFTKAVDNLYEVKQDGKEQGFIRYLLKAELDRDPIKDMSLLIETSSLRLSTNSEEYIGVTRDDEEFCARVQKELKSSADGLNKSQLLAKCGYRRDDKTARAILDKYIDRFWEVKQVRNKQIFYLKTEEKNRE
ncbi:MAG: AAA family ATPase [Sulfurovaceae bacterium]|nr:AAA family ATPase [Sulfurovaceae bacterium]